MADTRNPSVEGSEDYAGDRICNCRYSDADYEALQARLDDLIPALNNCHKTQYERSLEEQVERLQHALRTIVGPEDRGPWIDAYRTAGGGYAGLQAIARQALDPGVVVHGNDVVLEDGQRIPIQEFTR